MDPLNAIRIAAGRRVLLDITYRDSKGNVTTRSTEPYELRDDSYFGYDTDKGCIRNFKISGIVDAVVTKTPYIAKWAVQI